MAASSSYETYESDQARNEEAPLDLSGRYRALSAPSLTSYGRITSLDLSDNSLTQFPAELYELSGLRILFAKKNSIKSLPSDFKRLEALEDLNLSGNAFERFPPVLCELKRLKSLSLGKNLIESLPPQIHRLERYRR